MSRPTHYFYTESRGDGAYRPADATAITKPPSLELFCRILVRTIPCLSPKLAYKIPYFFPFAKTACVSVRKNSVDASTDKK